MVIAETVLWAFNAVRRACLRAPRSALLTLSALTFLLFLLGSPSQHRSTGPFWDEDQDGDGELIPPVQTETSEWDGIVPDFAGMMPPASPALGSLAEGAHRWPRLGVPPHSGAPVERVFPEALRAELYPVSKANNAFVAPTAVDGSGLPRSTFARDWRPPPDGLGTAWLYPRNKRVQHDFSSWNDSEIERERRTAVRNGFLWAWEAYKRHAWGHDEIKPVSALPSDPFNGWGATIIDSLDTLLLLDLPAEFSLAREHVRQLSFGIINGASWMNGQVPHGEKAPREPQLGVFETTIRYLGGLLGGYELSGDRLLLDRAEELAAILLPAFDTPTGLPYPTIRPGQPIGFGIEYRVSLAEVGSMTLEMTRLSQLTGNETYFNRVQRVTDYLDRELSRRSLYPPLFPTTFAPDSQDDLDGVYSFGGQSDSWYEYLVKQTQLLGGWGATADQYKRLYEQSLDRAFKTIAKEIDVVPGQRLYIFGEINFGRFLPRLEHLTCFVGAMLGLGSRLFERQADLTAAERITQTCYYMGQATESGLQAEAVTFFGPDDLDRFVHVKDAAQKLLYKRPAGKPMGVRETDGKYINRPETIESVFYMWRLTGDKSWQDKGWRMFTAWMDNSLVDNGVASIADVRRRSGIKIDNMESFALAETFKYAYLLHADPAILSLDDYVLNTEAHPFGVNPAIQPGSQGLWSPSIAPSHASSAEAIAYPSGQGTAAQLWAIHERLPNFEKVVKEPTKPHGGLPARPDGMRGGGGRGMGGGAGRGMLGAGVPWSKTPDSAAKGKFRDGLRQLPP